MPKKRFAQLTAALRRKQLVKITRQFEDNPFSGYVLEVGPRWLLLAHLSDGIRIDGFQCVRVSDVRELRVPHPYGNFLVAALKKRRERRPRKPRVCTADTGQLLLSAGRAFALVTIHRERINQEVCQIGRVLGVSKSRVSLLEIDPGACWYEEPTNYRLSEVTRVDFGGDYEDALHLVGGDPPAG